MWVFLPQGFYSIRKYDPAKGEVLENPTDEDLFVVRCRTREERDYLESVVTRHAIFDEMTGADYTYHLVIGTVGMVLFVLESLKAVGTGGLKDSTTDPHRRAVYASIHAMTMVLENPELVDLARVWDDVGDDIRAERDEDAGETASDDG